MKHYVASIYIMIAAESQAGAQAIAVQVARHLGQPDEEDLPERYFKPAVGGIAELKPRDPFGNASRSEKI